MFTFSFTHVVYVAAFAMRLSVLHLSTHSELCTVYAHSRWPMYVHCYLWILLVYLKLNFIFDVKVNCMILLTMTSKHMTVAVIFTVLANFYTVDSNPQGACGEIEFPTHLTSSFAIHITDCRHSSISNLMYSNNCSCFTSRVSDGSCARSCNTAFRMVLFS